MTETVTERRCPLCATLTDDRGCPECGYGTVAYVVTLHG
jgi:RNA polymerase subunit RPABC4/transcription elongation factor Spt4